MLSSMKPAAADNCPIGPVAPRHRGEALALVFRDLTWDDRSRQVEMILAGLASGEVSPQGLLGAHRDGRLVGAVFCQVQPGKTAVVDPPRTVADEPAETAVRLLEAACRLLAGHRVRLAQALLQPDRTAERSVLLAGGFNHLTDLVYLVCGESEFPTTVPVCPIEFEPYCPANHRRLARIVEATYQQTLDCPRLNGVRQIEDVLAGYRATGVFDPARWLIVRDPAAGDGYRDVGCLLLADHPQHENWELVYMGLSASQRGRGWGIEITRYAQWLTHRADRPRLVLAVDAANHPAIRMYAAAGFEVGQRRSAYLRVFLE